MHKDLAFDQLMVIKNEITIWYTTDDNVPAGQVLRLRRGITICVLNPQDIDNFLFAVPAALVHCMREYRMSEAERAEAENILSRCLDLVEE